MEYNSISIGQKLLLRGVLHGTYEAEVVDLDPNRAYRVGHSLPLCGDAVRISVVLHPGATASLLWVNPDRLMVASQDSVVHRSPMLPGYLWVR